MWPFSSAYPERTVADVDGQTYDYIVVGGGASGAVVASRLSEDPSVSVLLIERGPVNDNFTSRVPLISQDYSVSWSQGIADRSCEPSPAFNGRQMRILGAEILGGTTRINGMMVTRGAPGGYNEWADKLGADGWSWKDVEPYFAKMETALHKSDKDYRGHTGPYVNRKSTNQFDFHLFMEKACNAVGLPTEDDLNSPTASAQGIFQIDAAVYPNGTRVSTYQAYLNKGIALARKSHLTICTNTVATKLQLNNGEDPAKNDADDVRVTGVYVAPAPAPGQTTSDPVLVKARREVIVCGGVFRTPQLLMLSGIGPREHLVEEHGIPCIRDLPAVGQNLADHFAVPIMIELPTHDTMHKLAAFPIRVGLASFLQYLVFGSGMMATTAVSRAAFVRTSAMDESTYCIDDSDSANDASQPHNVSDVEVIMVPVNAVNPEATGFPVHGATKGRAFMTLYTNMMQMRTTGRVELRSATDTQAHTRIFYPELSNEDEKAAEDWKDIRRAIRFSMRLAEEFVERSGYPHKPAELVFAPGMDMNILTDITMNGPGRKSPKNAMAPALAPAPAQTDVTPIKLPPLTKTWKTVTDDEIDAYVRETALTTYHYCGTCRISKTAADGVVDTRLRVHGIKNLRVADATVFPKIPNVHTMAPAMMVAERCADFIREDWAGK